MSFNQKESDKQMSEPVSPDDIPLVEGESAFMKEKTMKRKCPAKNKTSKSKKIKTTYEYISESDNGSDSSIDDYEKNILYEMESGRPSINIPSNVAPFEFSAIAEADKFAQERGLPVLKPAIPPIISERIYGPHPNSLDPYNKISRFFNSIQLQYHEAEDCFYVEWEGVNIFASAPVLSYKRIYVIDYYFHILGEIMNGENKSIIISGPTGVGKTQMILFIIAYIRTLPIEVRPAVYIKTNTNEYTLYIEDQVYVVEKEENIKAVIEIIDSVSNYNKMLPFFGKRIEITNGSNISLSSLSINQSAVYYLQRWSKNDIKKCLKIMSNPPITPSLNWNENINNVYEKVGGIIKYIIISTTLNYDIDKEINESIEICKRNNFPIYYSWSYNNNNNNNSLMVKYADKNGLMYDDIVDDYYHLNERCICCDNTIYLTKNPVVKDFYNLFRRFIKLHNWKEMIFLLIGFRTINNCNDNSIKYEYHHKNELYDNNIPDWLINSLTVYNITPDMIFYCHYMVFTFKIDKKTLTVLFIYPEGLITIKNFSSYDVIYYPSSMTATVFTRNSQLKKDVSLIKYDYDKILNTFPYLLTPFAVLNEEISERQNNNLRSLPTVELPSIKEEIDNNSNNNNKDILVYSLSTQLVKTTFQTMQSLVLIENSIYYSYFEMIINNSEWQQTLFNLCRIIYISPHIELKLVLYYYLYKRGTSHLISLHCNSETGYIKAIYDVFGDAKNFISSFTSKINILRDVYPSLPKAYLFENINQNEIYF